MLRPEVSLEARAAVVLVTNSLPKGGGESGTLAYTAICSLWNFSPDPMHVPMRGSSYTSPNSWAHFRIWKCPMKSFTGINIVAKELMHFRVSQAPSQSYGLVYVVCFQGLLQLLKSFLYTHTE